MNKIDFINELISEMMYYDDSLEYYEAFDKAEKKYYEIMGD
jgi:hypothetical protein